MKILFKKGHKINIGRKNALGYRHTEEARRRISIAMRGKRYRLGNIISEETRKKMSASQKRIGNRPPLRIGLNKMLNYPEKEIIRKSPKYIRWRNLVYSRDNYTCRNCGKVGGKLNAHHIKSFSNFPELRFDIDNGLTLCVICHRKTNNFAARAIKDIWN